MLLIFGIFCEYKVWSLSWFVCLEGLLVDVALSHYHFSCCGVLTLVFLVCPSFSVGPGPRSLVEKLAPTLRIWCGELLQLWIFLSRRRSLSQTTVIFIGLRLCGMYAFFGLAFAGFVQHIHVTYVFLQLQVHWVLSFSSLLWWIFPINSLNWRRELICEDNSLIIVVLRCLCYVLW